MNLELIKQELKSLAIVVAFMAGTFGLMIAILQH
jgi:hypothetical protein